MEMTSLFLGSLLQLLLLAAATVVNAVDTTTESPETLFRLAVSRWRRLSSSSSSSSSKDNNEWLPWHDFSEELQVQFSTDTTNQNINRLEIVGAMEEGILMIERSTVENEQSGRGTSSPQQQQQEEAALSVLYSTYGDFLMHLTPQECLNLALDPHTLLIGAERIKEVDASKRVPDTFLCRENAENALRNALTLDATNTRAETLFEELTNDEVHKRKPKEFVAELFDSFADTFDDKLLGTLEYRVPELVGQLAKDWLKTKQMAAGGGDNTPYRTVMDAGCGTGLAGRYLRPIMEGSVSNTNDEKVFLIGVDASQKMLDKAARCTMDSGCGLVVKEDDSADKTKFLYDGLLNMDLEDMDVSNSLHDVILKNRNLDNDDSSDLPEAFDLIVAADVLVYFGSLEALLQTFSRISMLGSHLIFSCELATEEEAPLGWRLLPSGRFAHTKQHATDVANKAGYKSIYYEEIVPRMEKGVPVRGHLFGFEKTTKTTATTQEAEL